MGGEERTAAAQEPEPGADTIVPFKYTVVAGDAAPEGIAWDSDSIDMNGGVLISDDKEIRIERRTYSTFAHEAQAPLSRYRVDAKAPVFKRAVVNGASLKMTFDEDLNTTAPPNSAFTVTKGSGNTVQTLTGTLSISGPVLTLTLTTAATATDTNIKVDYAPPDTNPIKDRRGNAAAAFTDEAVANALVDDDPPTLAATDPVTVSMNGRRIVLTYNEPLDETSTPASSAFTITRAPPSVALTEMNPVQVREARSF